MAEGFANLYGGDVLRASSAGLAPTEGITSQTVVAMLEKNVDVSWHVPRRYDPLEAPQYDLIINMAGYKLPGLAPRDLREWSVRDPYGSSIDVFRTVRDDLEFRVMRLILELRKDSVKNARQPTARRHDRS